MHGPTGELLFQFKKSVFSFKIAAKSALTLLRVLVTIDGAWSYYGVVCLRSAAYNKLWRNPKTAKK